MQKSLCGQGNGAFLIKTNRSSIYNNIGITISFRYFVARYVAGTIIYCYNCSVVKPLNTYRYGY